MTQKLSVLELSALSQVQFAALRTLQVTERQSVLGKSFLESIDDWENRQKGQVLGLCFLLDAAPVGMVLFRKQPLEYAVSIHGLKIALPWQGRGLGHVAFRLAVEHLKTQWGDAKVLKLSVDAVNAPAIAIYRGFGMRDSGPVFDGPNGKEHRMVLQL